MLLHIVRLFYLLVVFGFTISFAFRPAAAMVGPTNLTLFIVIPVVLSFALVVADIFWRRKRLQALSGLFFGVLAGLAIAYVLAQTIDLVSTVYITPTGYSGQVTAAPPSSTSVEDTVRTDFIALVVEMIKAFIGASAVFMCVSFVLQTKDDFRFVIPYVEFAKQTKGLRPILLDSSVVIDGRIADIADTRILDSDFIVPRFILTELQGIADSDDKLKRNRGRRGLDILNRLQSNPKMEIKILDTHIASVEDSPDVDAKLVALAKHLDGKVMTNDYNLNKIAQLRGVDVININDLANALKPVVLPGEGLTVKIVKPGEEMGQGVGYLEDGTMVVAEGARESVGKEVTITVTSVLQTSAGRMIFGRLEADKGFVRRDRR